MTSQGDGSAGQPQPQPQPPTTDASNATTIPSLPTLDIRKTRSPAGDIPSAHESPERSPGASTSTSSLPLRAASPSPASSFLGGRSGTLTGILSRSGSPNGRGPLSLSRFGRGSTGTGAGVGGSPLGNVPDSNSNGNNDETRTLIVRAFSPVVGVLADEETDGLARDKGFKRGFAELIAPFGERVVGKVVVRDSVGASRSWEDFGVRFVELGGLSRGYEGGKGRGAEVLDNLEDLVEGYLEQHGAEDTGHGSGVHEMSPYCRLFLSRLLSSQPPSQHEAFGHPVASVIAISSGTATPIETLRNLYAQTAQGGLASPPWANPEYLRYYLLVHDDDKHDFAKSAALFEQMKRHFGLHCHLLRLRSQPCEPDDEDAEDVPEQEWLSASADLSRLQDTTQPVGHLDSSNDDDGQTNPPIFTTDATNIRTFTRELVSQSIIPHMEQRIALWNETIASRRRGLSGRFMSLSKRWGGISSLTGGGVSSRNSSATNLAPGGSASGNYDSALGYYRWDTPEALLRKMADFAVMLRDYKLAAATYEMLRGDYANDKAWMYLAGANEMCAVSSLLNPLLSSGGSTNSSTGSGSGSASTKSLPKLETFDAMLEAATYSYLSRANEPALALRAVLVGVELLKVRGRLASELAGKWAVRALELGLLGRGSNGYVLVEERVASCYAGATNKVIQGRQGFLVHRTRHAALWSVTAAESWMKLGRLGFAAARLEDAGGLYGGVTGVGERGGSGNQERGFKEMNEFMSELGLSVRMKMKMDGGGGRKRGISGVSATGNLVEPGMNKEGEGPVMDDEAVEVLAEQLDGRPKGHGHQRTLTLNSAVEAARAVQGPGSPVRMRGNPLGMGDDEFE